jgi:hypothetical protein
MRPTLARAICVRTRSAACASILSKSTPVAPCCDVGADVNLHRCRRCSEARPKRPTDALSLLETPDPTNEDGVIATSHGFGKPTAPRYSSEGKATAVRMVRTLRTELGTEYGTVQRVALQPRCATPPSTDPSRNLFTVRRIAQYRKRKKPPRRTVSSGAVSTPRGTVRG